MTRPDSFPGFLDELREINGPDFTPLDYINTDVGIPYVIAAQWLYVPDFVEYRGGLFRTELPQGKGEENLRILDQWYDKHNGNISKVERITNLLTFWDLFVGHDTEPYEEDLSQLARTVARSWDALLRAEFPDRPFRVEVYDNDWYGPQVTFFSVPAPEARGVSISEENRPPEGGDDAD